MEQQEVINITPSGPGQEFVIVHKKGLDEKRPHNFHIEGRIDAVSEFVNSRGPDLVTGQGVLPSHAVVLVEKDKGSITLILDPTDEFSHKVTGLLMPGKDLSEFKINTDHLYTRDALLKLVRFNTHRIRYADLLISALRKMALETNAKSKNEKDHRGNVQQSLEKTVHSGVPDSFVLTIPIFQGMEAETFRVDIIQDATDATVRFWLESTELKQLIDTRKEGILNDELAKLSKLLIIHKN